MADYSLQYGKGKVDFSLPDDLPVTVLNPQTPTPSPDPLGLVEAALSGPLGDFIDFRNYHSAAIAINDKTRPVPHQVLLPPLLKKLETAGISPSAILLILATGTHTPMSKEEFSQVLPEELLSRYPVISHDCDDGANLIDLGTSERGTPVKINRRYMEAELRLVVGNIEPHHFMGFSGGVKSAAIGLGGRETINTNHAWLKHPMARTGEYFNNPMRQDIEEIGRMIGVHYAVNAIMNRNKEIVTVYAGEPEAVMKKGIPKSQEICQVRVDHQYDIVIASPGGYPKDINFYQAQKALTHAAMITREGGTVILAAACPEGVGSVGYERWIEGMTSHVDVIERFHQEGFQVGPHKAFMVARDASRMHIIIVSEMSRQQVERLLLTPSASVAEAIKRSIFSYAHTPEIAILPSAVITIPLLAGQFPDYR